MWRHIVYLHKYNMIDSLLRSHTPTLLLDCVLNLPIPFIICLFLPTTQISRSHNNIIILILFVEHFSLTNQSQCKRKQNFIVNKCYYNNL